MASTGKCKFCGAAVRSDERNCPQCGGVNENYVANTPRTIFLPKTIDELKEYCAERGMPLLRMRFFVGEDFKEPRAFGIYRDGNNFVVYKNKADGTRAIRYRGPDEAHAVNELFQKLLQECHNRGIYPDGKPATRSGGGSAGTGSSSNKAGIALLIILALSIIMFAIGIFSSDKAKKGYYKFPNKPGIYYHIGSEWYYSNSASRDWTKTSSLSSYDDLDDAYLGSGYSSSWGVPNFTSSKAYDDYQDRHSSSSSDYDSWDSSDTDWDSDW